MGRIISLMWILRDIHDYYDARRYQLRINSGLVQTLATGVTVCDYEIIPDQIANLQQGRR